MITLKNFISTIKRNLYLAASILVFALSLAFAASTMGVLGVGNHNEDTSVGYIYLGGLAESDYETVLVQKVSLWQADAKYQIVFQGYTHEINLNLFQFDVSSTLSYLESGEKNQAYFTMNEGNKNLLIDQLETSFSLEIIVGLDIESLITQVMTDIGQLKMFKTYLLSDHLPDMLPTHASNSSLVSNLSIEDINAIIGDDGLELKIQPKSRFSLLSAMDDMNLTNNQLSIIASGLQKLLRDTPMSNFTFEQNYLLPIWAEPGMNVRILQVNQYDFTFYNPLEYEVVIHITSLNNDKLTFKLDNYPFISTFSSNSSVLTLIPYQVIYVEDETVNETTIGVEIWEETTEDITYRVLVTAGVNGSIIQYNRTETLLTGETESIRLYEEETMPVNALYHYYTYLKDGE